MNYVFISGRVTRDIELKYGAQSQMAVARFSLACDRGKDKDGNNKGADFISCVAFGRAAENLEKFSGKGLRLSIIGHIQTGNYEKDGKKYYTTDVVVDRTEIVDWKDGNQTQQPPQETYVPEGFAEIDQDIPF